jgi:hypothetical protein
VHELAPPPVDVEVTGVPVAEAGAHGQHQVALQERGVAPPRLRLYAGHPGEQRVVLGEGPLAHERDLHRDLQVLGQRPQLLGGVADDHATARQDDRPPGLLHEVHGRPDGLGQRAGHLDGQRRVQRGVVPAGTALDVEREVDEHGAGPS